MNKLLLVNTELGNPMLKMKFRNPSFLFLFFLFFLKDLFSLTVVYYLQDTWLLM